MRESENQYDTEGNLVHGFDHELQVWVFEGICDYIGEGGFNAGRPCAEVRKELGLPVSGEWPTREARNAYMDKCHENAPRVQQIAREEFAKDDAQIGVSHVPRDK